MVHSKHLHIFTISQPWNKERNNMERTIGKATPLPSIKNTQKSFWLSKKSQKTFCYEKAISQGITTLGNGHLIKNKALLESLNILF